MLILSSRAYSQTATPSSESSRMLAGGMRVQTLLTPEAGLLGQGVRFIIGGCTSAAVYLLSTSFLALVVGLPFEVALAIGFCLLIAVNFTLHRMFVWVHHEGFALPVHRQFGRYMSFAGAQYALTAASVAALPRALGMSTELIYIATAVSLAVVSFTTFRHGVFHAKATVGTDSTGVESPAP